MSKIASQNARNAIIRALARQVRGADGANRLKFRNEFVGWWHGCRWNENTKPE